LENIKSTEEVIEEFLEYSLSEYIQGTPHSNSIVMAPLKMLYTGRRGKEYRRRLADAIAPRTKQMVDVVRDIRLMLQEMDFNTSASDSGSEVGSDNEL
jgi:tRNA-dihydrouridine synthase A